jgi:spore coat polysaccharide biosynthesis protein SpsF (cytidylyltransferase family)
MNADDVAVVIQARLGSNRFPGKSLAPLAGKPVIAHVLERVYEGTDGLVAVAIPDSMADDPLYAYLRCFHRDTLVHRGSTWNVLQRFYEAAKMTNCGTIVRITADCPLLDSAFLRAAIHGFCSAAARMPYWGWCNDPDGSDIEIMSFDALEKSALMDSPDHREHVTTGLRAGYDQPPAQYGDVKYSVDTIGDLRRCEALLETVGVSQRRERYSEHCRLLGSTTVLTKTQQ